MKYNDNGEIKEITLKTLDTLPEGSIVEYDGEEIPSGWVGWEADNWKQWFFEKTKNDGSMNLPSHFNELYIETQGKSSAAAHNDIFIQYHIFKESLLETEKIYRKGYYFNTNVNGSSAVVISLTKIRLTDTYMNGVNQNTYSTISCWYR